MPGVMELLRQAPLAVLALALAVSLVTDLRSRRILDAVTLPALAVCLLLRMALGMGLSGLAGAAVALGPFLLVCAVGGMGIGDVKLMAVAGAALGFPGALEAVLLVALAGGVQAALAIAWALVRGRPARGLKVPYGVAI